MDAAFWHHCWQQNLLGFQLADAHPLLRAQLAAFPTHVAVFVPLCGKSPDLHALASRGPVVGAELSDIACRDFFAEAGLSVNTTALGDHQLWQHGTYRLWQGDFFQLPVAAVTDCQWIYDRAALIALPATMRQHYADTLRRLLPSAAMLLISLEYPAAEKQGPPFAVTEQEIRSLFQGASISLHGIRNLTGQGFARRTFATSMLVEKSYWIRW
jgi:thiopurine S-methyltransferase